MPPDRAPPSAFTTTGPAKPRVMPPSGALCWSGTRVPHWPVAAAVTLRHARAHRLAGDCRASLARPISSLAGRRVDAVNASAPSGPLGPRSSATFPQVNASNLPVPTRPDRFDSRHLHRSAKAVTQRQTVSCCLRGRSPAQDVGDLPRDGMRAWLVQIPAAERPASSRTGRADGVTPRPPHDICHAGVVIDGTTAATRPDASLRA